jgi:alpha-L-rhamnosidase
LPLGCALAGLVCGGFPTITLGQQSPSVSSGSSLSALHDGFAHPPDDCRIMMRWWWFGPSETNPELKRELEQMKAAGIGGVEITTLYALALDDPDTGFHNYDFTSDEHLDHLRFAADEARRLGMRVDITLGNGWPFGGPHIPVTQAAGGLRVQADSVTSGSTSIAVPPLEAGERLMAAFVAPVAGSDLDLKDAKPLPLPSSSRLDLPADTGSDRRVLFFISSRTGMMVKRPAVGAGGFVLDHYDDKAIENHLHAVGDRLLSAFGDHPPYAVFSDSLEDYASNWTPDLLSEFQRRRGYDLTPLLPALVGDFGPDTGAIRHDWGQTLTELANERFLQPIHAWAQQHHTLFRSQTYGFPPVTLSSNRYEDLPEGEGKASVNMWRQFSDTRWAASAGHLFDHNVISSETWTWLHSPSFRATPLDIKAEADLHFLQGINQLVGHGWPYSPEAAGEPGWRMYAAGAFNAHNPWFAVMPDLTAYLQRVSYALRLGKPANDVALLLPNDDVWATFVSGIQKNRPPTSALGFDESGSNVTIDESLPRFLKSDVIPQILDAGFNIDFIDADAIDAVGIPYKVLVLPGVDRLPLQTYEKILDFAQHGGIVIATRRLPATAPGLSHALEVSSRIQALSQKLFHGEVATAHFVSDEHDLGNQLGQWMHPDFVTTPSTPEIGFLHRHLDTGDLYFIANTSNRPHVFQAAFRASAAHAEVWDPFSGRGAGLANPNQVNLDLQPYESRIVFLSKTALTPAPPQTREESKKTDLSQDWTVSFGDRAPSTRMQALSSWADDPRLRYFSGEATYRKTIDIPDADLRSGHSVVIDFGEGSPVPMPTMPVEFNMRAYLDSPVREAAQVYVNDQLAGYVWHPPFRVELSPCLKLGKNELRIVVGNTAINELAGTSLPNYRLLYSRYGMLFQPQGMNDLQPLPSGILGPITLIEINRTH